MAVTAYVLLRRAATNDNSENTMASANLTTCSRLFVNDKVWYVLGEWYKSHFNVRVSDGGQAWEGEGQCNSCGLSICNLQPFQESNAPGSCLMHSKGTDGQPHCHMFGALVVL